MRAQRSAIYGDLVLGTLDRQQLPSPSEKLRTTHVVENLLNIICNMQCRCHGGVAKGVLVLAIVLDFWRATRSSRWKWFNTYQHTASDLIMSRLVEKMALSALHVKLH